MKPERWAACSFVVALAAAACLPRSDRHKADEDASTTSAPLTIDRTKFSFRVPPEWKEQPTDSTLDTNHLVQIDGPHHCMLSVSMTDSPLPAARRTEMSVDGLEKSSFGEKPSRTSFDTRGTLKGVGVELVGKSKFALRSKARIFSHSNDKRTYAFVEFCPDEEVWKETEPGFEMTRTSFVAKE